jgi:lycopene cyclase domain-containing protein
VTLGYTLFCFVALVMTGGLELILRTGLLRDRRYWITLAIMCFFQLLVDGWLTCRPIVTYAERQFSGIRFGCPPWSLFQAGGMPLEDLIFGYAMITQGLMWWCWWGRRLASEAGVVSAGE